MLNAAGPIGMRLMSALTHYPIEEGTFVCGDGGVMRSGRSARLTPITAVVFFRTEWMHYMASVSYSSCRMLLEWSTWGSLGDPNYGFAN